MFKANQIINKNSTLNHIHVFNEVVTCKIFPNLGASIQQLSINSIDILDGISISEEGLNTYRESYQSALMFPFVGRIPKGEYKYKNKDYILNSNESNRPNALHGLVYDKPFTIDTCETTFNETKIQLKYSSDATLIGFPFKFEFSISYIISNEGIKINFKIINQDKNTFPFGCGWHPYFKTDYLDSSTLSFSANEKLKCDHNLIPNGKMAYSESDSFTINQKTFDDTFILSNNQVILNTKQYHMQLSFSESTMRLLQIYTPSERESIAIEPVTCSPNAFNSKNGLMELNPEENFSWDIDLKIHAHV